MNGQYGKCHSGVRILCDIPIPARIYMTRAAILTDCSLVCVFDTTPNPRFPVSPFLVLQIRYLLLVVVAFETYNLTLSNQTVNLLAT